MIDAIGHLLRGTSHFPGRGRLVRWWLRRRSQNGTGILPVSLDVRPRQLPGGAMIMCEMSVPYEAMAWLRREEQDDLLKLQRMLHPGQTFVDCGANIGMWSLVAAKAVGPSGKVIAFEPNPRTFARLTEHIERNNLSKTVRAINACAGAEQCFASFRCETEHNISRVVPLNDPGAIRVPVATLDVALAETRVRGIKIDVEGQELEVLRGAEKVLGRDRPWICVEFNATLTQSPRLGDWDVHRRLSATGYRAHLFVSDPEVDELSGDWKCQGYRNLLYLP